MCDLARCLPLCLQLLSYPLSSEAGAYTRGRRWTSISPPPAPVIRFEDVTFCYPNRPDTVVFENLTFEIPAGKVVAFVGESGAGMFNIID